MGNFALFQDHLMPDSLPILTFTRTGIVPTVSELKQAAKDFARVSFLLQSVADGSTDFLHLSLYTQNSW